MDNMSDHKYSGEIQAQGEGIGDVWVLVVKDNKAFKRDLIVKQCPHCGEKID